jgi:hypothetical protein
MTVMAIPKFERFFRAAAALDIDKDDLKRYSDFVEHKLYDLLLRGEANAKANVRDVMEPQDLPITKGLQESIHAYKRLNEEVELEPVLKQLALRPQLDVGISEETEARFPRIIGGMSVALARTFTIIDPKLKNPSSEHWDRAFQIFDTLL